jgi:acetyl-CoA carboxylase biotin carboxyl carrier protein
MIDIKKLNEIVKLMVDNDLTEVDLQDGEETVTVKRGPQGVPMIQQMAPAYAPPSYATPPAGQATAPPAPQGQATQAAPAPAAASGLIAIESPMVGTFYSAPNPDTPAFVKPGSQITNESVVCLIEAMKVFNEIKAEKTGVIEQVLVKNGEAVEFGQKLFLVRPS